MLRHLYLDTSALVKHYITEVGSHWVQSLVRNKKTMVFTSSLTRIEGVCTIFNYDLVHRYVSRR